MRRIAVLILSAAALAWCAGLQAQGYPTRAIRVITTVPPGSAPDIVARVVSQRISDTIGRPVPVENRVGAGGLIGATAVSSSPPDGYNLLMADTGIYAILPHQNSSFEPLKVLQPITLAASTPIYLAAGSSLNVSNVKELIAAAKAKPGLPYGSGGNGTAAHLFMELIKSIAAIDLTHVPHKGVGPAVQAVVAGDVAFVFAGMALLAPHAKAGKLRFVGVGSERRSPLMPDLPTVGEQLPGYDVKAISVGFLAPAGTPADVVEKLRTEISAAVRSPEVLQRFAQLGIEPATEFSPERFADTIRQEQQLYGRLFKLAGASAR